MGKFLKAITWARWQYSDPYDSKYFTMFTASILHPSFEYPIPCVSMSVLNAGGRVFMRFLSVEDMEKVFLVPESYRDRLAGGYKVAIVEANTIQTQLKTLMRMGDMAPGSQIVRTDTGEVIAEGALAQAERILKSKA